MSLKSKINYSELLPISSSVNDLSHLCIGECDVVKLVETFSSPLYVIDEDTFLFNCNQYLENFKKFYPNSLILYASKSFASCAIFQILNKLNMGIDVVSGGELNAALKIGFNKKNIYFHGNNKSFSELDYFIKNQCGTIVCDNFYELNLIETISKNYNLTSEILIRLTPGIECHTHEYIKTGHIDSKFGFTLESFNDVLSFITNSTNIQLKGLHSHIGSQIFEIKPYEDEIGILLEYFNIAKKDFGLEMSELNIGGGIGVAYTELDDPFVIKNWIETVSNTVLNLCKKLNLNPPKLLCEPGRSLICNSGVTLYTVGNIKEVPDIRKYVAVDGGMADNPRPITYQAIYRAFVANKMNEPNFEKVTIVGRFCETGDVLIKDIDLPKIDSGDVIAIPNTGAYNYSMSSNYNLFPKPACVLVKDGKAEIIIERETYDDLILKHKVPARLS